MIICDTSPLIALAILDHVDLLAALYREWYVPPAVVRESTVDKKPFAELLQRELPKHTLAPRQTDLIESLRLAVDAGEAEVLALAREKACRLVLMDDRKGRLVARSLGLQPVGVLGVLIRAKRERMLREVSPCLEQLRSAGIRISPTLVEWARRHAGE